MNSRLACESGERASELSDVRPLKKAHHIVEHQAVLRIRSRKYAGHAHGTENIEAGQFVVLIQVAFGNPTSDHLNGASATVWYCTDEANPWPVQPRITRRSMSNRGNDELGTARAVEPACYRWDSRHRPGTLPTDRLCDRRICRELALVERGQLRFAIPGLRGSDTVR